jgi:micrococcal nuclease
MLLLELAQRFVPSLQEASIPRASVPEVARETNTTVINTQPSLAIHEAAEQTNIELRESLFSQSIHATESSSTSAVFDQLVPSSVYQVVRVIDGDTIEVAMEAGIARVRYIGVDTPETVHPSRPVECFGYEAAVKNRSLVEGKWVRLERDVSDVDRYGRLLRYVYVDDELVNLTLIREGYASVVTYPPDVKYADAFLAAEQVARAAESGLWGSVCQDWVVPSGSPTVIPSAPEPPPSVACAIKGNINNQGEKIYHYPGCRSYDQTLITEATGERWFCSPEEAIAAGWRVAGNCPQ